MRAGRTSSPMINFCMIDWLNWLEVTYGLNFLWWMRVKLLKQSVDQMNLQKQVDSMSVQKVSADTMNLQKIVCRNGKSAENVCRYDESAENVCWYLLSKMNFINCVFIFTYKIVRLIKTLRLKSVCLDFYHMLRVAPGLRLSQHSVTL